MKPKILCVGLSLSPSPSILAVVKTVGRAITVAETKLTITATKPAGTPQPFGTISGAHVHAAVFLFCGGKPLHLESMFQLFQGDSLQGSFPQ